MKKFLLFLTSVMLMAGHAHAQRQMETLDRGLVAVKTPKGVYTSWRIPGEEWYDVTYNLYRDGALVAEGLTTSNFTDPAGSLSSTYSVAAVRRGTVGEKCDAVSVWANQYLQINLQPVINPRTGRDVTSVMSITDSAVADLDGDGQYEFIVKRQNTDWTITNDSAYTRFEAYKLDGTRLWQVNLGPNLRDGNGSENACFAFDFDEDGKAEVIFRGGDGTILPDGTVLGNPNVNYRTGASSTQTFTENGDEWIVMLDGATGETLDYQIFDSNDGGYNPSTNNYGNPASGVYEPGTAAPGNNLARRSVSFWREGGSSDGGHRATKFYFGAPYLDGRHPYVYLGRGCYTNYHAATWRVINKKLVLHWACAVDDRNSIFYGQGYHNFTIADVDMDGRDEICHGNMVVDENGKFHSSTGLGHGDALHFGDLDPFRDGVESFRCLEDNPGTVFVDANTNEILFRWKRGNDCGRCLAGNFTNEFPGAQLWTVDGRLWSASTSRSADDVVASSAPGVSMNARIYWDGDILEESFDGVSTSNFQVYDARITKYGSTSPIFQTSGCLTVNSTKSNPCWQADFIGDWREEFMLPTTDNRAVRIYTTVDETKFRNYTLMHDPQYRQAVYWQSTGYNQPPHVSYFLGELEGIVLPPPPATTNGKTIVSGSLNVKQDEWAIICDTTVSEINGQATSAYVQVNSPADHTFRNVSLSGATMLIKQGQGNLTLADENYAHTGNTEVWYGSLTTDATITSSALKLKRFARLMGSGTFGEVEQEFGSTIYPGGSTTVGTVKAQKLSMQGGAIVEFDIKNDGSELDQISLDSLVIGKANCIGATPTFYIRRTASGTLDAGEYVLVNVSKGIRGDISTIKIDGLKGLSTSLKEQDGKIILVVESMRVATDIVMTSSGDWDLNKAESFMIDDQPVSFVSGDNVTIDASEANVIVNITEDVEPASLIVKGSKNITFVGNGRIGGSTKLIKRGSGLLTIRNVNDFTGGVVVEEGRLSIINYADAQNDGSLGAYQDGKNRIRFERGTTLIAAASGILDAAIEVGDSTVFQTNGALTIQGSLSGKLLVKTGASSLSWTTDPQLERAILEEGTWNVGYCTGRTFMADTMQLHAGTLAFTSGSLYQSCSSVFYVPEGKTATVSPSNTLACQSKLIGAGTLNWTWHTSSTPREYLEGDWSEFAGTLNMMGKAKGSPVRFCNTKGMPNATVKMADVNTVFTVGGDADTKKNHGAITGDVHFGELTGPGTLGSGYTASNAFYVGSKNTNFTFAGSSDAPFHKVGTGRLTMTGNVGSGAVYLDEGELRINGGKWNSSSDFTTASGTGLLTVGNGTLLMATGCAYNAQINVKAGGVFRPGYNWTGTLHTRTISLEAGGTMEFRLNKQTAAYPVNTLTGHSTMYLAGTIEVLTISNLEYQAGDSWQLWSSNAFSKNYQPEAINLPELPDSLVWDTSDLLTKNGTIKVIANPEYTGVKMLLAEDEVQVTVVGLDGKIVARFTTTYGRAMTEAEDGDLRTGVYIVRIEGANGSVARKIVK